MLINRDKRRYHLPWCVLVSVIAIVAIVWFAVASRQAGKLVGGGSLVGLVTGSIAAGIIFFEMLLWPRKWLRRIRLIPTKYWMAAHLWLGLLVLPLAIIHCGLHLGGWLPTLLFVLLTLVYLSGIYGLVAQLLIPRWMLRNIQAETIATEIDFVAEQTDRDLHRLLTVACGRPTADGAPQDAESAEEKATASANEDVERSTTAAVVIGTVRKTGAVRGRWLQTTVPTAIEADAEPLWTAYSQLRPFLLHGAGHETPFSETRHVDALIGRLRRSVSAQGQPIVDAIEEASQQRHQFDVQQRTTKWLHGWIPIHVILSVAVVVLLIAHLYTALRYW